VKRGRRHHVEVAQHDGLVLFPLVLASWLDDPVQTLLLAAACLRRGSGPWDRYVPRTNVRTFPFPVSNKSRNPTLSLLGLRRPRTSSTPAAADQPPRLCPMRPVRLEVPCRVALVQCLSHLRLCRPSVAYAQRDGSTSVSSYRAPPAASIPSSHGTDPPQRSTPPFASAARLPARKP